MSYMFKYIHFTIFKYIYIHTYIHTYVTMHDQESVWNFIKNLAPSRGTEYHGDSILRAPETPLTSRHYMAPRGLRGVGGAVSHTNNEKSSSSVTK